MYRNLSLFLASWFDYRCRKLSGAEQFIRYGDDFVFIKQRKINMLASKHLSEADIDTDPSRFHNWDRWPYGGARHTRHKTAPQAH